MKRDAAALVARAADRRRRGAQGRQLRSSASPRDRCRGSSRVVDHRWPPSAIAIGAGAHARPRSRGREAPAALARPPQADHLLHLHRLRAGDARRRVLRARRRAAVLQFQRAIWCAASSSTLERTRAARPRTTSPSRSSGTAGASADRFSASASGCWPRRSPNASIAVVRVDRDVLVAGAADAHNAPAAPVAVAGPWTHVAPPSTLPAWIGCDGFGGLFVYGDPPPRRRLAAATGPFDDVSLPVGIVIRGVALAGGTWRLLRRGRGHRRRPRADGARIRELRRCARSACGRSTRRWACCRHARPPGAASRLFDGDLPLPSIAFAEYHDWQTGQPGLLTVAIRLSIPEIYRNIDRDARRPGPRPAAC